jgi:hypothetical protein
MEASLDRSVYAEVTSTLESYVRSSLFRYEDPKESYVCL